jgi:HAD superfamily hydrolase (TIGR01484 family)
MGRATSNIPGQMAKIRLLSTDFDGTLVNHFATPPVSPALINMFRDLQSEGVLWAVNTGRELHHIEEGLQEFRFPIEPDFVLTAEREVYHRGPSGRWQDYGDWNARCGEAHEALFHQSERLLADIRAYLERDTKAHPIYEGNRMIGLAAATDREMDLICDFLEKERVRVPGFHFMRNTVYVRFCHEDYSKGTALGELARLTRIPVEQIFAAGDHFNDLPMLDGRHARWVACPGNSVDAVKAMVQGAGGYVARGECSDGVVEALRHFAGLADEAAA